MSADSLQRATLAKLADVLIPGSGKMPAASSAGVAGELLNRCLSAAPSLEEPLLALLEAAERCEHSAFARDLATRSPEDFAVLSTVVVGAYYLSEQVRDLIGYPGQVPSPLSIAGEPEYLPMLERVYERHEGYRSAE